MRICPDCGSGEALDAARNVIARGMSDDEWSAYKAEIIERARQIG